MLLGAGETLVLYTDGITEARNEKREMLGLQRWREIAETNVSANGDNLTAISEAGMRFIGKAEQTDDLTVMCISKRGEAEPMRIRVENRTDQWPALKNALHNYGLCAGVEKRALKKLEVALEEAVVNIVSYSQATEIGLRVESLNNERTNGLKLTLSDDGIAFDPTIQASADTEKVVTERQIGGLGITLLKQIADGLQYRRREDGKNELIIIKNC